MRTHVAQFQFKRFWRLAQLTLTALVLLQCASVDAVSQGVVRRRLEALPGFNVGTTVDGMDVARNGASEPWTKWDSLSTWAQAGVASNTFYVKFLPRDDPPPGRNTSFSIKSAVITDTVSHPNEANCSVTTTPATGTAIVAGNFTQSFGVAYSCAKIGQVQVEVTLAIAGYSDIAIVYLKTNGNALDVGLHPNASEAVVLGSATATFSMTSPQYVVPYESDGTQFFFHIAPGQLPHTLQESISSAFTVTTIPDHVVDIALSGPVATATSVDATSQMLIVNYTCKSVKQLASTVIQLSWAMSPFAPVEFSWLKDCSRIVGLDITQLAGDHASQHDVVKGGEVIPSWQSTHYFSAFVSTLTFQMTSSQEPVPLAPPTLQSVTSVCTVTMSGSAAQGATVSTTPLTLILTYTCAAGAQGVQNNTVELDFGKFGKVEFDTTKFVGHRPSFDVTLTDVNVTANLTSSAVITNGVAVGNWTNQSAFPFMLPSNVGVLPMQAVVSNGQPFQLGSPFEVATSSHSGQCDPHIRPDPAKGGGYYIGSTAMPLELTFWCKSNTNGDFPRFTATFPDADEYFTTSFAFRKETNIAESFAVSLTNGTQVVSGGVATAGWDSTGHAHLTATASDSNGATTKFDIDNKAHVINQIDVLPFVLTPNVAQCSPTSKLSDDGTNLEISYGCDFSTVPSDATDVSLDLDIIVMFSVTDSKNPGELFSPPMMHWDVTITYQSPDTPTTPQNLLVWILSISGAVVVIVIVVVLAVRFSRHRNRSPFVESAQRPLTEAAAAEVLTSADPTPVDEPTAYVPPPEEARPAVTSTSTSSSEPKRQYNRGPANSANTLQEQLSALAMEDSTDSDDDNGA